MREICTRFSYFELNIFNTPESPNVNDFLLSVCLCQWRHNVTYLFDLHDLLDNRKNKHRQARHQVEHHWDDASGAGRGADNPGNWVSWSCRGTAYHFRCERCSVWTLLGPYCQQRNKHAAPSGPYWDHTANRGTSDLRVQLAILSLCVGCLIQAWFFFF